MVDDSLLRKLDELVGLDAGRALMSNAARAGWRLAVPSDAWTASGYTGAIVASLFVDNTQLVVKVCPAGQEGEVNAHRRALDLSPEDFRKRHLVELARPGVLRTEAGSVIFFQSLAGSTRDCRPIADLSADGLSQTCIKVAGSLITEWNDGHAGPVFGEKAGDFLRRELSEPSDATGSVRGWASSAPPPTSTANWITTTRDPEPLCNPLSALIDASSSSWYDHEIDYLAGFSHGDLHLQNVLLPQPGDAKPRPGQFRLIDMTTFRERAPLLRDQVSLVLSLVPRWWPDLSDSQRDALLIDVSAPHLPTAQCRERLVAGTVRRMYRASSKAFTTDGWLDKWKMQYLLVLHASALRFTTFSGLGRDVRWWMFRLAAHAATRYLALQHDDDRADRDSLAVAVVNPFDDVTDPTSPLRAHRTPTVMKGVNVPGGLPPGDVLPTLPGLAAREGRHG